MLSQEDGRYAVIEPSADVGFFHGGAAADLMQDGNIDVVVTNNFDDRKLLLLENAGDGTFHVSGSFALPASIASLPSAYFSAELVDVDEDGLVDLILGGHEWEGGATVVLINPGENDFSGATPVTIPAVANEGVVLDFTVTGSGATRTIWIVRSSGGDGTFYESRVVQRVRWSSLESTLVLNERPQMWLDWALLAMVDGEPVLTTDNAAKGFSIPLN
ncbi:MAG TPA: VCBS repeat-containing protein [Steroidobacter sp.]